MLTKDEMYCIIYNVPYEQPLQEEIEYVCVAQLDRALGYGPRCREFESSHARELKGNVYEGISFFSYKNDSI